MAGPDDVAFNGEKRLLKAQKRESCIAGVCCGWGFGARHACIYSETDKREIPCFGFL